MNWVPKLRFEQASDQAEAPDGDAARASGFAWAIVVCGLTTALAVPLRGALAEANLLMFYLLAVVFVTVRFGRRPGILASILAVLAFDVFMVPPYLSLTVADPQYLLTLTIMLIVSLLISHLTANLGRQAQIARQREIRAQALFALSRELSGAVSNDQIGDIGVRYLNATFQARAAILFPDEKGRLAALGKDTASTRALADAVHVIARLVYEREVTIGYDEGATTSAGIQYLPLRAPLRTRGVLVLIPSAPAPPRLPEQERLLLTCAAQIALAIERVHHGDMAHRATLAIESERLRNSLLSAVSHDIRTPLTTIIGMSAMLASTQAGRAEADLAISIRDAAVRMSKLVTNLLDMARLHDGSVKLNRQWQMVEEIVGGALAHCADILGDTQLEVAVAPSLPLIDFDAALLERVLCNLLDNAVKYAGPGAAVRIAACVADGMLAVSVEDNGRGIPPGMETTIFDKFSRGETESAHTGVGLGLAICKAIVEAHGGRIVADNLPTGGARVVFTLPLGSPPAAEVDQDV